MPVQTFGSLPSWGTSAHAPESRARTILRRKAMAAAVQPALQPPAPQPISQSAPASKTDWAPTAKVSIGALAGTIIILLTAFLGPHWKDWTKQDMTPAIGAAITNVLTFAIQYLVPERKWTIGS